MPVTVSGVAIAPGDLLHGDVNGLLTVPDIDTDRLLAEVQAVRDEERALLDFIRTPGFTLEALRKRKYGH